MLRGIYYKVTEIGCDFRRDNGEKISSGSIWSGGKLEDGLAEKLAGKFDLFEEQIEKDFAENKRKFDDSFFAYFAISWW